METINEYPPLNFNFKSFENNKIDDNSSDNCDEERPSVRWAPLGATSSPEPSESKSIQNNNNDEEEKEKLIAKLEDEQEKLTCSLTLLTSHFAQVQLRLKQIASDKTSNIDDKISELEEFANKGLPDVWSIDNLKETVSTGKQEQTRIINDLKQKLEELESFAYQTGDINEPPTSKVLANQKFIMEQLRSQLDINFDSFISLNENELKNSVDNAINEIVNPVKVREKLVEQLKTQIQDLERFIQYLQDEELNNKASSTPKLSTSSQDQNEEKQEKRKRSKRAHDGATQLIRKALNLLQLIAASQFGCQMKDSKRIVRAQADINNKTKEQRMHWGDVRAGLEVSIQCIIELANQLTARVSCSNGNLGDNNVFKSIGSASSSIDDLSEFIETQYNSEEENDFNKVGHQIELRKQILQAVRRDFCPLLIKLIGHGLCEQGTTYHSNSSTSTNSNTKRRSSLSRLSCFSGRRFSSTAEHDTTDSDCHIHPWDLITYFYDMKNGREIVNSPACKLSESFYLSNVGGKSITSKEKLLKAIGVILDSHSIYRRSKDTHFKAFVCLALNERCLSDWLKMILKNRIILYSFYESWSYAHKMGFDDTIHSLKRLSLIEFDLPYDFSVRQLYKIRDAF